MLRRGMGMVVLLRMDVRKAVGACGRFWRGLGRCVCLVGGWGGRGWVLLLLLLLLLETA